MLNSFLHFCFKAKFSQSANIHHVIVWNQFRRDFLVQVNPMGICDQFKFHEFFEQGKQLSLMCQPEKLYER